MSVSFQEALAQKIYDNPRFQQDFSDLLRHNFLRPPLDEGQHNGIQSAQIKRLSESAIILASSSSDAHNRTAFEVASLLYEGFSEVFPGIGGVTKLICSRLGNTPVIDLLNPNILGLPPA